MYYINGANSAVCVCCLGGQTVSDVIRGPVSHRLQYKALFYTRVHPQQLLITARNRNNAQATRGSNSLITVKMKLDNTASSSLRIANAGVVTLS